MILVGEVERDPCPIPAPWGHPSARNSAHVFGHLYIKPSEIPDLRFDNV
jgi:hypothetical protein